MGHGAGDPFSVRAGGKAMRALLTIACCLAALTCIGQQEEAEESVAGALESETSRTDDREPEDDGRRQLSEHLLRHRFNINQADPEEMGEALGLSDLQVRNFERYRRLLGPFTDLLELQAVPGWDPETIRRVLPYLILPLDPYLLPVLRERLKKGEHLFLLRTGAVLEKAEGYRFSAGGVPAFTGDRSKALLRYNYRFRTLLQWGITAEKDPGEAWFPGGLRKGFDFQSWHLSMREFRWLKAMVIGDYQVNLGQGLIHWQGLAFRKTGDALQVMRQGQPLRPYNGTDENRFHRGVGVHLHRRSWEFICFFSRNRMDGNLMRDTGSGTGTYLTSMQTSGLHRTIGELQDKDAFSQRTVGGSMRYIRGDLRLSFNAIRHQFSIPLRNDPRPYDLHAVSGTHWSNYSVSFGHGFRNMHLFGEAAIDQRRNTAFISGMMASLHARADMSLLYRHISPAYRAFQANAFTENPQPMNESGLYAGITIRPHPGWRVDAYMDLFEFPWLSYRVDRPSSGSGHLIQAEWKPHKKMSMHIRWQQESKPQDHEQPGGNMSQVLPFTRSGLRWQLSFSPAPDFLVRSRVECTWQAAAGIRQQGFLAFLDIVCKPMGKSFSLTGRLTMFDTEGYGPRVYAFENDVIFLNAVSVFSGKGMRYYLVFSRKFAKHWHFSCKISRSVYPDDISTGSGSTAIEGSVRTELRGQLIYRL